MKCIHCQTDIAQGQTNCPNCSGETSLEPQTFTVQPIQPIRFNSIALVSFIGGLCSTLTICWRIFLSIPTGVAGLICGLVSRKNPVKSGFTTAGITLSLIGLISSLLYILLLFFAVIADQNSQ